MYYDRGDLLKAENHYRQILIDLKETPPAKEANERLHSTRLGILYWTQDDKLDASGTKLEGSLEVDFSTFKPWFVSALSAKNGLAIAYMKEGRLCAAETLFKEALEGREKADGPTASKTFMVINHLGTLETLKGNFVAAESLLRRALAGTERRYGPHHTKTQIIISNLGLCYLESAQYGMAEDNLNRAAHNLVKAVGPIHPFAVTAIHNQGLLHLKQNEFLAAGAKFEQAIEGWKASSEGVAKSEGDSKYCLATIYEAFEEEREKAEALLYEAETLYGKALGKKHPQTMETGRRADQLRVMYRFPGKETI